MPSSMASLAVASTSPPTLLVTAGAGLGKTNTLAHRVAHLIVNGADPGGQARRQIDQLIGDHMNETLALDTPPHLQKLCGHRGATVFRCLAPLAELANL